MDSVQLFVEPMEIDFELMKLGLSVAYIEPMEVSSCVCSVHEYRHGPHHAPELAVADLPVSVLVDDIDHFVQFSVGHLWIDRQL